MIKTKYIHILFCLLIILKPAISFSQNYRGGGEDGYSISSIVNSDLNIIPEYFSVEITLADGQLSPSSSSIINFKATFNKNTSNFSASDVIVGGTSNPSSTAIVTGGPLFYNIAVSGMTNDGIVNVTIPAGVCTDNIIGSQNAASVNTANSVDYQTQPGVELTQAIGQTDPTGISPINFTATFSEPVTGFVESDITLSGTASATTVVISGAGLVYNIAVSGMIQDGTVSVSIPANVCNDLAGNSNTSSINTDNTVTFDNTSPTVSINQASGQTDPSGISPINFTVSFSEPVSGFVESDIALGGTAGATTVVISGIGPEYNISVSGMNQDGTVIVSVPADVCNDLAGNSNISSIDTDNSVNFDMTSPGVSITPAPGQTTPTGISPVYFTITFSEPVIGFDESDIALGGTAGATTHVISGIGPEYNIAVSGMTQNGTVIISVPADVCNDLAGNPSLESFSSQVEYLIEEITKFEANNIFTPNSNFNRFWIIKNINLYTDYELIILNNSGQKIYQAINYQNNWNGTYKNQALPTGTYFYSFSSPDKRTVYKGFINIIYE